MDGRGRKKVPTSTLEKRGSWRAKGRDNEPVFDACGHYPPPERLQDEGKKLWNKLFPMIRNHGVLKDPDISALERYCAWWDMWTEEISYQAPDINKLTKIETALIKLESQFGLTPASRPNVKAEKQDDNSKKTKNYFKVG